MPMGCDHSRWTPGASGKLTQLSPILQSLEPVRDQVTVITNTRLQNSYPGTHDTSNSGPERGVLEAHRELGLLPGHDDRSDCGEADRPRHAAAVARTGDGSESARRRMQQRICVCLSELPVVVVADDLAAIRSASTHRVRAPLRRGREHGGAARRAAWQGESSIRSAPISRG